MKELLRYEPEYADFDKLTCERDEALRKLEAVEQKLSKKEDEVRIGVESRKQNMDEFLARNKKLQGDLDERDLRLKQLQDQMQKDQASEKAKAMGLEKSLQSQVESLNAKLTSANTERQLLQAKLDVAVQELAHWKRPAEGLQKLNAEEV